MMSKGKQEGLDASLTGAAAKPHRPTLLAKPPALLGREENEHGRSMERHSRGSARWDATAA